MMNNTQAIRSIQDNISRVIKGKPLVIEMTVVALLARGHLLLEDVPGVGKTTLAHSLARSLDCSFKRIQFTSDLLPSDIVGVSIFNRQKQAFEFMPGPIFANIVLADEINRTTPKTQSSLLEAMSEAQISVDNQTHPLSQPFMVIATQNPSEYHGTFPLPESQLDRFLMKIVVNYPSREELNRIVDRTVQKEEVHLEPVMGREEILELRSVCRAILVAPHVQDFAIDLVMATQPGTRHSHPLADKYIRYGSSPRGAQALVECGRVHALLAGRAHLAADDIEAVATAVLRHRIICNFDAHADGQTPDSLLEGIIRAVKAPTS